MGNSLKDQHYKNMDIRLQMDTSTFEAESVAYTVCQHFGIDTSDYSFGYIAGWSSGKEMPELKSSLDTIRRTSSELIKGIGAQLLEIEKERAAEQSQEDIILLVSNTDRSEYDLLNVKGMERTEIFNLLSTMKDDDRQNVEAYLERAGALRSRKTIQPCFGKQSGWRRKKLTLSRTEW